MQRASTRRARDLRRASTPYERQLWELLRRKQLEGFKFRRQHPIGHYYADFACPAAMIVVELDGQGHDEQLEYDAIRNAYMEAAGWKVLRFSNRDLMSDKEAVWHSIAAYLPEHAEQKPLNAT